MAAVPVLPVAMDANFTPAAAAKPLVPPKKKRKRSALAPKKPKKPKRPKLSTPERRERKRVRDRDRRRLKRKLALEAKAKAEADAKAKAEAEPKPVASAEPKPEPKPAKRKKKKKKKKKKNQQTVPVGALSSEAGSSSVAVPAASASAGVAVAPQHPQARRRATRVNAENNPEILKMEGNIVPTDATVQAETASFNRTQNITGMDAWLEAEMKDIMSRKVEDSFSLDTEAEVDKLREELPRFRRAEEDTMLHETLTAAEACEMNDHCESVRMSRDKGISPPIRLPSVRREQCDYKQCLMCLRKVCTEQLMRLRMDRCGMVRTGCLQSHANYINIGEYRVADCLPCRHDKWEGLALPMVQHRDSGYEARSKIVTFTDDSGASRTREQRYWCQEKGYPLPTVQPKFHARSAALSSAASGGKPGGKPGGKSPTQRVKTQRSIQHFLLNAPQISLAE